jgi:lipoprotein NlpI
MTKWPASLINLYLGEGEVESVLAAAKTSDAAAEPYQLCDANFYLAELALIDGNTEHAIDLFGRAQELCSPDYWEHYLAVFELDSLKKSN